MKPLDNERRPTTDELTAAIRQGVNEALFRRQCLGLPIIVWENGQVVWKQPDPIDARADQARIVVTKGG